MTKPDDIEQWAWDEAKQTISDLRLAGFKDFVDGRAQVCVARALQSAHARGVKAERERCAIVAQGPFPNKSKYDENSPMYGADLTPHRNEFGLGIQVGRTEAAQAIRNRGSAS